MCEFFFFNDTATTEIYTLSLHDALPIYAGGCVRRRAPKGRLQPDGTALDLGLVADLDVPARHAGVAAHGAPVLLRSEEHTSELQSRQYLVCRLLLEKKKK